MPTAPHDELGQEGESDRALTERVICGLDSSPEGIEAVRQAHALVDGQGDLTVLTALDIAVSAQAGWAATSAAAGLRNEAQAALEAAKAEAPGASFRLVEGRPDRVLLAEAERERATLLVVGTHGISRPLGVALASVPTVLLHEAPCSVLVARGRPAGEALPRSMVVGLDGSPQSGMAWAIGRALADRLGMKAWPVAVRDGKTLDRAAVEALAENALFEDGNPVDVLVGAAEQADLLVLGSRGLVGVRALGSVSERVAHKARCSVLVVRPSQVP